MAALVKLRLLRLSRLPGSSNIAEWIAWIAIGFGIVYALKPYTHDEKGRPIKKS